VDERGRRAERVTVPDVVGLTVDAGRHEAEVRGVVLAAADPDGPPLGAMTWPGEFLITAQSPPPGTSVFRWDSVVVTFRALAGGSAAGVREPRRPLPDPGGLRAARPLPSLADDDPRT
jgi:hypothetical protein